MAAESAVSTSLISLSWVTIVKRKQSVVSSTDLKSSKTSSMKESREVNYDALELYYKLFYTVLRVLYPTNRPSVV
jgi:hypothetical protein